MMYYLFALVTLVGLLSTVCKDVLSVVLTNWQEPPGVGLIIGRPPYHLQHNKYRNNDNRIILYHTVFLKCVQLYFSTATENISVAEGVCLTIDHCTSTTTKRFHESQKMSQWRSPRNISRAEGNLEFGGDASRLEEVYGHSLIINPYIRIYQEIYPSQYFPAIDERMIYICNKKKIWM